MRVLYFRTGDPVGSTGTFSDLQKTGLGGTELQLLLHVANLQRGSHTTDVIGVSSETRKEEGVNFLDSSARSKILAYIREEKYDIIFVVTTDDIIMLRELQPNAFFVQVCQNGPHLRLNKFFDVFAFVGPGQLAYYSIKYPRLRKKFIPLYNVPPVTTVFGSITAEPSAAPMIIWVGAVEKQGFRRWATAMARVLREHEKLEWLICAPAYSSANILEITNGLSLPAGRFRVANLPLRQLAQQIANSKLLIASLGGEDGPVSYLDGHALGVPVLCGDDIIGKFSNPDGFGLRCTTSNECYSAISILLTRPDLAMKMGSLGKQWLRQNFTEQHQQIQLSALLMHINLLRTPGWHAKSTVQSDRKFSLLYYKERLLIKLLSKFAKHRSPGA